MRTPLRADMCVALTAAIAVAVLILALPTTAMAAVTTTRVSVASGGAQASDVSWGPSVSADGRFVAFASAATNLVLADANGFNDIFVYDRLLGTTEIVSVPWPGALANGDSSWPSISADGRFVVFDSLATNLVGADGNGASDVFVHDRLLGTTERASVKSGGGEANGDSAVAVISADGRFVAFRSAASNLVSGDGNGLQDVFVHDCQLGTTQRVNVNTDGTEANGDTLVPAISSDGRFVAFVSSATNLVGGDVNLAPDVFVHDCLLRSTERVSLATGGAAGNGNSLSASVSADGRFVAFASAANNLVPGDNNGAPDVFVRDRRLGTTDLISASLIGTVGDGWSGGPAISSDGRDVAFWSRATNLVAGDTNNREDVFVRDRFAGLTDMVSVASDGTHSNDLSPASSAPRISADGRDVTFDSRAWNLVPGDTNNQADVFVADRGQFAISATRAPSKSSVTYTRKNGVVKFALSVTVKDARSVRIASTNVYLQSSANGSTKWKNAFTLATNGSGVASHAFKATKRSTTYYRWVVPVTDARLGFTTSKQKVVVK